MLICSYNRVTIIMYYMLVCVIVFVQWLHEESLIVPDSVHAWIGQQRSALLTTIKKVRLQNRNKEKELILHFLGVI